MDVVKKFFVTIIFFNFVIFNEYAYSQDEAAADSSDSIVKTSMSDLLVIGGFGAGGAILGLSTLPFFNEPFDHFENVIIGGAIGVILGVGFVIYSTATKEKKVYETAYLYRPDAKFSTVERYTWNRSKNPMLSMQAMNSFINYRWAF